MTANLFFFFHAALCRHALRDLLSIFDSIFRAAAASRFFDVK
jgi:hypothetical protein